MRGVRFGGDAELAMQRMIRVLVFAAVIGAPAGFAQNAAWTEDNRWQEVVTDTDAARLANMPQTRAAALREAEGSPEFPQIAALVDAPTQFGTID